MLHLLVLKLGLLLMHNLGTLFHTMTKFTKFFHLALRKFFRTIFTRKVTEEAVTEVIKESVKEKSEIEEIGDKMDKQTYDKINQVASGVEYQDVKLTLTLAQAADLLEVLKFDYTNIIRGILIKNKNTSSSTSESRMVLFKTVISLTTIFDSQMALERPLRNYIMEQQPKSMEISYNYVDAITITSILERSKLELGHRGDEFDEIRKENDMINDTATRIEKTCQVLGEIFNKATKDVEAKETGNIVPTTFFQPPANGKN